MCEVVAGLLPLKPVDLRQTGFISPALIISLSVSFIPLCLAQINDPHIWLAWIWQISTWNPSSHTPCSHCICFPTVAWLPEIIQPFLLMFGSTKFVSGVAHWCLFSLFCWLYTAGLFLFEQLTFEWIWTPVMTINLIFLLMLHKLCMDTQWTVCICAVIHKYT